MQLDVNKVTVCAIILDLLHITTSKVLLPFNQQGRLVTMYNNTSSMTYFKGQCIILLFGKIKEKPLQRKWVQCMSPLTPAIYDRCLNLDLLANLLIFPLVFLAKSEAMNYALCNVPHGIQNSINSVLKPIFISLAGKMADRRSHLFSTIHLPPQTTATPSRNYLTFLIHFDSWVSVPKPHMLF